MSINMKIRVKNVNLFRNRYDQVWIWEVATIVICSQSRQDHQIDRIYAIEQIESILSSNYSTFRTFKGQSWLTFKQEIYRNLLDSYQLHRWPSFRRRTYSWLSFHTLVGIVQESRLAQLSSAALMKDTRQTAERMILKSSRSHKTKLDLPSRLPSHLSLQKCRQQLQIQRLVVVLVARWSWR